MTCSTMRRRPTMSNHIQPVRRHTVYKLTDQAMQTYGGYQWHLHETRQTRGTGELCSDGWLHCYADPRLATLLNPIHAGYHAPRLFEARADGVYRSDGLKAGVSQLTLTREFPVPQYTPVQRVAFGIL